MAQSPPIDDLPAHVIFILSRVINPRVELRCFPAVYEKSSVENQAGARSRPPMSGRWKFARHACELNFRLTHIRREIGSRPGVMPLYRFLERIATGRADSKF